ncbi:hypothetical protein ABC733_18495 [Mangrovibacter sp. SLW1]
MPGEITVTREQLMSLATAARQLRNPRRSCLPVRRPGSGWPGRPGVGLTSTACAVTSPVMMYA